MGNWSAKINDSDSFQDIYQNFFNLYNQGGNPVDITKQIQEEFADMFIDFDDKNNCLFGLALAQWETKSLESTLYKQVKEIIETKNDIEKWKQLGADYKTLEKRQKELVRFLSQISIEREKPKRRVLPKYIFTEVELIRLIAPDNRKQFIISEYFTNGVYQQTGCLMMWQSELERSVGGGSVFYYNEQGKDIKAKWLDNNTLELNHEKDIVFTLKKDSVYYWGDNIKVIYKTK